MAYHGLYGQKPSLPPLRDAHHVECCPVGKPPPVGQPDPSLLQPAWPYVPSLHLVGLRGGDTLFCPSQQPVLRV